MNGTPLSDGEVAAYLDRLEASDHFRRTVVTWLDRFRLLAPEPLIDLHISQEIEQDGGHRTVVPVGLWAFTTRYWLESRSFHGIDYDISPYKGAVLYLGIGYDGDTLPPAPDSYADRDHRMQVEVRTANCEYSILTACTPGNCANLFRIVTDRLRPNLIR